MMNRTLLIVVFVDLYEVPMMDRTLLIVVFVDLYEVPMMRYE
jgi:hypothetical protein